MSEQPSNQDRYQQISNELEELETSVVNTVYKIKEKLADLKAQNERALEQKLENFSNLSIQDKKSKTKYYAVGNGRKNGIFESWAIAEPNVTSYPKQNFKGYDDLSDAKRHIIHYENELLKKNKKFLYTLTIDRAAPKDFQRFQDMEQEFMDNIPNASYTRLEQPNENQNTQLA